MTGPGWVGGHSVGRVTDDANTTDPLPDDPADGAFPESVAAGYDGPGGANAAEVVGPVVDLLAELADGGPVLELAVGTGRIAAPLAAGASGWAASSSAGRWPAASPTSRAAPPWG
nr:hypothetical protein GCM10025730_23700 [Promicromonospora thailandica]